MRKITSQLTRFEEITEAKRAAKDYAVQLVTLTIEGEEIEYVVDGHHSYEAAILDGVEPEFEDVTDVYAGEIRYFGDQAWLNQNNCGEGWYELETGKEAW